MTVALFALTTALSAQARPGPRVYFAFQDAPVGKVIQTIEKISGQRVTVCAGVEGKVSVRLRNIGWRDALSIVAKSAGCEVHTEKGKLTVRTTAELKKRVTETIELGQRSTNGAEVEVLRKMLSKNGTLEFVPRTKLLMVKDELRVIIRMRNQSALFEETSSSLSKRLVRISQRIGDLNALNHSIDEHEFEVLSAITKEIRRRSR